MLLFIGIGMLAGSEGIGGIYFDDASLAQSIGIISLIFILFSGGLETKWSESKKVYKPAFLLATGGVLVTAVIMGLFVMWLFDTSFIWGFLIGSIVSSTDAAAVFSILRAGNINLKGKMRSLLELESGSNDPMALFLTISTIELILSPEKTIINMIGMLFIQLALGGTIGWLSGHILVFLTNRLKLFNEGIYPVFILALAFLIYSFTSVIGSSGFLAIYVAGVTMGNSHFVHKKAIIGFFDGLAILAQIAMFLTLGLLVFPSEIKDVFFYGLFLSLFLMFIARPLSVILTLIPFKFSIKEQLFISWVGLRGAVPIILATFPLLMGVENSHQIFNIVFFVVLTSGIMQGWTINSFARLLQLTAPFIKKRNTPIDFTPAPGDDAELMEFYVPDNSSVIGKQIVELNFPHDSRIVLIIRDEKNIIPSGGTVIEGGDVLSILVNKNNAAFINNLFK
jgi:potassium/hydrogen antiporter